MPPLARAIRDRERYTEGLAFIKRSLVHSERARYPVFLVGPDRAGFTTRQDGSIQTKIRDVSETSCGPYHRNMARVGDVWTWPISDGQLRGKQDRTAPWNMADTLWAQCPDLLAARELAPHDVGRSGYTVTVHGVRVFGGWQCGSNTPSVAIPEEGTQDLRATGEPPRRRTIEVMAINDTVASAVGDKGVYGRGQIVARCKDVMAMFLTARRGAFQRVHTY